MRPLALAVLLATAAAAQTDWRPVPSGATVSFDALAAVGDDFGVEVVDDQGRVVGEDVVRVSSRVALLAARVPVGAWTVLAEVPVARVGFAGATPEGGTYDQTDVAVGNPFVGVERSVGRWAVGGGVRVPVYRYDTRAFGWQGGATADRERFEAYLPDLLTVSASAATSGALAPSVRLAARLAPALVVDVSGAENAFGGDPTGLVLGYGVRAEGAVGPLALHGGVVGRPVLSGDRFGAYGATATAVAGASARVAGVRPGVLVRVPVGTSEFFRSDATVGVTLDVPLR